MADKYVNEVKNVGIERMNADKATSMTLGYNDTYECDSSAADVEVPSTFQNCRAVSVDVSGLIKVAYTRTDGEDVIEVKQLTQGQLMQMRNVVKVYRYYVGTTACTTQIYLTAGTAAVGLKLHR